jgi:hypothetical protein
LFQEFDKFFSDKLSTHALMQFPNLHIIGEGSTEEPNTVHNVGDAPELEDPKTKVIFHILDCHILVGK